MGRTKYFIAGFEKRAEEVAGKKKQRSFLEKVRAEKASKLHPVKKWGARGVLGLGAATVAANKLGDYLNPEGR